MRDTIVAVTEREYEVDGCTYRITKAYYASGAVMFCDSYDGQWVLGERIPHPDTLAPATPNREAAPDVATED